MMKTLIEAPAIIRTGIAEYDGIAAGLTDLKARYEGVRFEVETTAGDKQARAARFELVRLRVAIEAKRKELKAPALERSRLIDSVAKQITSEIEAIEGPIDAQIRAQEERKESERLAKIKAEADRLDAIRARIGKIRAVIGMTGSASGAITESIAKVESMEIDASYQELQGEAEQTKARVLSDLADMHVYAKEQEDRRARLDAERAELDRQRAKDAAERKAEDERRAAAQKIEDARLKAERDKLEAEQKAERDRLAKERAEFQAQQAEARKKQAREDAERDAKARAERDRIDAEWAEMKRLDDEAKAKAEAETIAKAYAENAAEMRLRDAARDLLDACKAMIAAWDAADEEQIDAARFMAENAIAKAIA
jgi:colicin import membrane protein